MVDCEEHNKRFCRPGKEVNWHVRGVPGSTCASIGVAMWAASPSSVTRPLPHTCSIGQGGGSGEQAWQREGSWPEVVHPSKHTESLAAPQKLPPRGRLALQASGIRKNWPCSVMHSASASSIRQRACARQQGGSKSSTACLPAFGWHGPASASLSVAHMTSPA